MSQQILSVGTRAVSIYWQGEDAAVYSARVYVNCDPSRKGKTAGLGDATLVAKKFASLKGATKWAQKELGA